MNIIKFITRKKINMQLKKKKFPIPGIEPDTATIPNKTFQHPNAENLARKAMEGVHLPEWLVRATEAF